MVAEFPDADRRAAICEIQASDIPLGVGRSAAVKVDRAIDAAAVDLAAGSVVGYGLTWAYDADGYRFARGCFAKTIVERVGKIPLMVKHAQKGGTIFETAGFLTEFS